MAKEFQEEAVLSTDIKEYPLYARGKVRDVYDLGDKLLIIATDRISAFDVVLPNGIPGKGKILNSMSVFWFEYVSDIVPNHLIAAEVELYPENLQKYRAILEGRSMLVKKARRIDIECVVRGYISGSLWKEYVLTRKDSKGNTVEVKGIKFPASLIESAKLPQPIFTPATKASSGHDENISFEQMCRVCTMRWPIEQCFEEGKSELGMDHYEHRSWPAWHRHMTFVFMAQLFLLRVRHSLKKNSGIDAATSHSDVNDYLAQSIL